METAKIKKLQPSSYGVLVNSLLTETLLRSSKKAYDQIKKTANACLRHMNEGKVFEKIEKEFFEIDEILRICQDFRLNEALEVIKAFYFVAGIGFALRPGEQVDLVTDKFKIKVKNGID